jgi:hypothetical protein
MSGRTRKATCDVLPFKVVEHFSYHFTSHFNKHSKDLYPTMNIEKTGYVHVHIASGFKVATFGDK